MHITNTVLDNAFNDNVNHGMENAYKVVQGFDNFCFFTGEAKDATFGDSRQKCIRVNGIIQAARSVSLWHSSTLFFIVFFMDIDGIAFRLLICVESVGHAL